MRPHGPLPLGLFVEGQEGVSWEAWVRLADSARAAGFQALLQSDHCLSVRGGSEAGSLDAWTTVVALAAVVPDIRLGTLVSPVGFRHPVTLARMAASGDAVSGGRIDLGLGAGWFEREHEAFGFEFGNVKQRFDELAEQLAVVRWMWSGEPFSFTGRRHRLVDARPLPAPVQPGGPTLIVGADGGPRSIALAAAWADEYNTRSAAPTTCRRLRAALDDACAATGRDPATVRLSLLAGCIVGETRPEVEARAERCMRLRGEDARDPAAWIESRSGRSLVGTPLELRAQLESLRDAGADRVILQLDDPDDLAAIELIGREIVPHV
jgi:alkanesulfonate monooxygenase SsuD/methylene tetrahydromethanopterin reductase-like flavin-dependent oxidoreductase (luciferase family)